MVYCTNCGAKLEDDVKFCVECGTPVSQAGEPVVSQAEQEPQEAEYGAESAPEQSIFEPETVVAAAEPAAEAAAAVVVTPQRSAPQYTAPRYTPVIQEDPAPARGSQYALISTGGYIGIFLLLAIPIVGQIFMIIWACGGCKKLAKRNLCRAMLVLMLISMVLFLIGYFGLQLLATTPYFDLFEQFLFSP
jgi:hypothetical protein